MRLRLPLHIWCIWLLFISSILPAVPLHTLYGDYEVTEQVLQDLLSSSAVQRLRFIHQYGVQQYVRKTLAPYNRYEHSVGVMVLLRRFGAPLQEQIAGLLHDASHTVFSHVGDHVMALYRTEQFDQNDESYQDNVHTWYLAQTDVKTILDSYTIAVEEMDHKNGHYPMLERELPDICADRLEYNLYGGYIEGLVTEQEVHQILSSLHWEGDRWFFDDQYQARKLADLSLWLTEHRFASPWNFVTYEFAAKALARAVEIGFLTMHDIHFAQDDDTWQLLLTTPDTIIQRNVRGILFYKNAYQEVSKEEPHDASFIGKFRVIDPWVQSGDAFKRLTAVDDAFHIECERVQAAVTKIRYIKYRTVA